MSDPQLDDASHGLYEVGELVDAAKLGFKSGDYADANKCVLQAISLLYDIQRVIPSQVRP